MITTFSQCSDNVKLKFFIVGDELPVSRGSATVNTSASDSIAAGGGTIKICMDNVI